jgi:hypothetical protein
VVEPDATSREAAGRQAAYRDLRWMSEEELLNTSGLQAIRIVFATMQIDMLL